MFISHLLQHLDLVRAHAHDLPEYLVVRHHAEPEVEQQHCPDGHDHRHTDLATLSDVICYIMGTWGLCTVVVMSTLVVRYTAITSTVSTSSAIQRAMERNSKIMNGIIIPFLSERVN